MSAAPKLKAPFPYFGGKSKIAAAVWERLGRPKQYVEPFCGSAAMLLAAPAPAALEVVGDLNCYVANFWRAVKFRPAAVAEWQDYPVSHIDLAARHRWLVEPARVAALREALSNPEWPGDAQIAGWWLWGQCAWIGSGWCDGKSTGAAETHGKIPVIDTAGKGIQKIGLGQIPHVGDAGRGTQADGQIPHVGNAGRGPQGVAAAPAAEWLGALSTRLARVRLIHGSWDRCVNTHYGDMNGGAAIFFDPPYKAFESLYSDGRGVAYEVEAWCRDNVRGRLRVALCGHVGDYDLPGWMVMPWSRGRLTYGSGKTTDAEAIWFSPACLNPTQRDLFSGAAP